MSENELSKKLQTLIATSVLDVATGSGYFAELLKENVKGVKTLYGVDQKPFDAERMRFFAQPGCNYRTMNATRLDFIDASFDLVAISNSIHHFPRPEIVLLEMKRVLKPNGTLIVFEMFNNHQNAAQLNAVHLHQWWAKINQANGIFHDPRYDREDLIALLEKTVPGAWEYEDLLPDDEDPFDVETQKEIDENIDQNLLACKELSSAAELIEEGKAIRSAIHQNGFLSATELLANRH
jgi:ubiquinone/menaquinone biosynthesis C-methylase UbiE